MFEVPSLIGGFFADVLTAAHNPLAAAGGAALSAALSEVMNRWKENARETLLDELRHGEGLPPIEDIDESVAILYRYWRAAQEGTARLNLRLLAAVYAGQVRERAIVADEFLSYADILASLRSEEITLLGTFLRHSTNADGSPAFGDAPIKQTREELVPQVFADHGDFNATLGVLLRTGFLSANTSGAPIGGGPSMVYQVTSRLRKLNNLADIEGVIVRDRSSKKSPFLEKKMVQPNRQAVEQQRHITVQLGGKNSAAIFIDPPASASIHSTVDLTPLLKGGLDEGEALDYVLDVVRKSLRGTTLAQL